MKNLQTNVADTNSSSFIRALTTATIEYCIEQTGSNTYKFNEEPHFNEVGDILRYHLDGVANRPENKEVEALYAIQGIIRRLEIPKGRF